MNLKLKKNELVNLSDDAEVISENMTPHIGGGTDNGPCPTDQCETDNCGISNDGTKVCFRDDSTLAC